MQGVTGQGFDIQVKQRPKNKGQGTEEWGQEREKEIKPIGNINRSGHADRKEKNQESKNPVGFMVSFLSPENKRENDTVYSRDAVNNRKDFYIWAHVVNIIA
jgi:hypothetical protein